jgi:hypothetical protein
MYQRPALRRALLLPVTQSRVAAPLFATDLTKEDR